MRIVVIGGSGHVGSYLVPRLHHAGHEVISLSRGARTPYVEDPAWSLVEQLVVDRDRGDADGTFPGLVRDLGADVVIDLICFTPASAQLLVDGLRGSTGHLIHCGSVWMHGQSDRVPILESDRTEPFGDYGVGKARIAAMLSAETASGGLVTTSLHPGHISGPGWHVINPVGNTDPSIWQRLAAGEVVDVPGLGTELLSHVHADDVAQAFALAVDRRDHVAGEALHVAAGSAVTVRGLARRAARWFGREANLRTVTWDEFRAGTSTEHGDASWEHLVRSHHVSIEKARRLLGYTPAHEPEEAVKEAVAWLIDHDQLAVSSPMIG